MSSGCADYRLRVVIGVDVPKDRVGSEAEALKEAEALGRWVVEHLSRPMWPISRIYAPVAERHRRRVVRAR